MAAMYRERGAPVESVPRVHYGYELSGRHVLKGLLSREEWELGDERWHLSVSAEERVPTWDEMAAACHALRPGVPFVLGVPPRSWWLNIHPYVLHAWETKDRAMLAQWRANAKGHTPS
jgi:hypothetical protein